MWVYEEEFEGKLLSQQINETHENAKYLPGVSLGTNVRAEPDLVEAARDCKVLVICAPHEFVHGLCNKLQGNLASGAIAVSLTKGMRIRPEGPQLISEMVRRKLGMDCSVLMGANIASEIGAGQLSEATIGYKVPENAKVFQKLFQSPTFNITLVQGKSSPRSFDDIHSYFHSHSLGIHRTLTSNSTDVEGAEMCGTLKNIVALAAGMSDGLGYGSNTKAAIIRQGLSEMKLLSKRMYPSVRDETFLESCGVGSFSLSISFSVC